MLWKIIITATYTTYFEWFGKLLVTLQVGKLLVTLQVIVTVTYDKKVGYFSEAYLTTNETFMVLQLLQNA